MNLEQVLSELREEYLESFSEKQITIIEEHKKGRISSVELEFHKMKGTGQTYGIPEVSRLGQVMEKTCQDNKNVLKEAIPLAVDLLQIIVENRKGNSNVFDIEAHPKFLELKKICQEI